MALLHAGSEHASFDIRPAITSKGLSTVINFFDPFYARGALQLNGPANAPWGFTLTPTRSDIWIHCDLTLDTPFSGSAAAVVRASTAAGVSIVELAGTPSGSTVFLRYFDGTSYVTLSSPIAVTDVQFQTYDLHLQLATSPATSTITLYQNGTQVYTTMAALALSSPVIGKVEWVGAGLTAYASQCIVASENTVGWKARTLSKENYTGGNTFTDWEGSAGNANTISIDAMETTYQETTYMSTGGVGSKSTNTPLTFAPPSDPPGGPTTVVGVVFYGAFSNIASSAVNDISLLFLRTGSLQNSPGLVVPQTNTVVQRSRLYTNSPFTNSPWTAEEIIAMSWGLLAI
jgi:hypothetical protein